MYEHNGYGIKTHDWRALFFHWVNSTLGDIHECESTTVNVLFNNVQLHSQVAKHILYV